MVNRISYLSRLKSGKLGLFFNSKPSKIMHLDLNSCFATIEQQANPKLRGKPIAVAAYNSPSGCIVAPSIEAKRLGVKVGMRVKEAKLLYPKLIVLSPDPWKYRNVHLQFKRILSEYADEVVPKSIDEFVLDLESSPVYKKGMINIAEEIKTRIKQEIGEWISISVGIAPNRFLAKTAAGLHKPNGLDFIDKSNYQLIYQSLNLMDLCGIKVKNAIRLNNKGVFSVWDFYNADSFSLKSAFGSIIGYWWYLRLRGWEVDDVEWGRKSYGNSFSLPKPLTTVEELSPILRKLVEKTGFRLRKAGYKIAGVHLAILFRDGDFWHKGVSVSQPIFDSGDIYKITFKILNSSPVRKPVRELAVSCFNLKKSKTTQLALFEDVSRKERLVKSLDKINDHWGQFVITPATMLGTKDTVIDRVAFGGVKELEEIVTID